MVNIKVKTTTESIIKLLHSTCKSQLELAEKKNSDYGNALIRSFRDFGAASPLVMVSHKVSRLYNLRGTIGNDTKKINFESIEDSLLDLMNYCVMATILLNTKREKAAVDEAEKSWNTFIRLEYGKFRDFTACSLKLSGAKLLDCCSENKSSKDMADFVGERIEDIDASYVKLVQLRQDPKAYGSAIPAILKDIFALSFTALAAYQIKGTEGDE